MKYLFVIMYINLLLGAVGVYFSSRNKPKDKKKYLWEKYLVYMIIIHIMLYTCIFCKPLYILLSFLIATIGAYEIIKLSKNNFKRLFIGILIYIFISVGFLYFNIKAETHQILVVFCLIVIFDGFSQIAGHLFGKTLICKISPSKTYEGFIGGFIVAIFTFLFLVKIDFSSVSIFVISFILIIGFLGDILASYYKRLAGVKDYSNLIPAHGGVLDRFDSFILACSAMSIFYFLNFIDFI